jgi:hypothetical protein
MLGELIYQGSGKRIVRRILSTEPVNVEVTFEAGGQLLGADVMEIGTYTSLVRPDGTMTLSRLNTVAGVFEFEADENGNIQTKVWEWK